MFAELAAEFEGQADLALHVLESGLEDSIAVLVLPQPYRRRLRTTNMCERLNEELRRRERVIRIFPNQASAIRMLGALLAEQHESWLSGQHYWDLIHKHPLRASLSAQKGEIHKLEGYLPVSILDG